MFRGNGDRRFNDWHYSLPADWHYIDLDGMEVCPRCRAPLLLFEVSRDPQKATSILGALARRADLPAVLVLLPAEPDALDDSVGIRWRSINPARPWADGTLGDLSRRIGVVRDKHLCERPT